MKKVARNGINAIDFLLFLAQNGKKMLNNWADCENLCNFTHNSMRAYSRLKWDVAVLHFLFIDRMVQELRKKRVLTILRITNMMKKCGSNNSDGHSLLFGDNLIISHIFYQ